MSKVGIFCAGVAVFVIVLKGGDTMAVKRKSKPYVLKLKKGEKPIEMSKARYDAAIDSVAKYVVSKKSG